MRLFFETGGQGAGFLAAAALGFALAMLLDGGRSHPLWRAALDVLLLTAVGAALLWLNLFLAQERLRSYHLLGMTVGALLYVRGTGEIRRAALRFLKGRKKRNAAGNCAPESEVFENHITEG